MSEQSTFREWAIVELMGHRRLAGLVEEVQIAGAGFLRLDVHGENGVVATQLYSPGAVYCITPTTEEMARATTKGFSGPVSRWELSPALDEKVDDEDDLDDAEEMYG